VRAILGRSARTTPTKYPEHGRQTDGQLNALYSPIISWQRKIGTIPLWLPVQKHRGIDYRGSGVPSLLPVARCLHYHSEVQRRWPAFLDLRFVVRQPTDFHQLKTQDAARSMRWRQATRWVNRSCSSMGSRKVGALGCRNSRILSYGNGSVSWLWICADKAPWRYPTRHCGQ
jgi:hypothetical protein